MIVGTDALHQFGHWKQPSWFSHSPFVMNPLGFNRVEPGTLAGQPTDNQPTAALLLDQAVMSFNPSPNLVADVPGSIVPNEKQGPFPLSSKISQKPRQKGGGDSTRGLTIALLHVARFG